MSKIIIERPAALYLKKLKDRKLKALFLDAINIIAEDYTAGEMKTGDLKGIYCYDIRYCKTDYRLAYRVEIIDGEVVVVIMAGPHENFYRHLKKYLG